MAKSNYFHFIICGLIFLCSCNQNVKKERANQGIIDGKAVMLADESLYPIVDDEYEIFAVNYQRANIDIVYKPQQELLKLFLSDSIDVAIMPRKLNQIEEKFFNERKITIRSTKFAIDGIALITGQQNADSVITVDELKSALLGKSKNDKTFVFDNPKSSTVEYLMNLSSAKVLPRNFYALNSNKDVIKYIKKHPDAIGIVSVTWIKRPTPDVSSDVEAVKVMGVGNGNGVYQKPSQSNLKLGLYPLIRDLYLINCQGRAGLGTGFAAFLAGELGQRIILKSGLAPDSLPSRQINIRN
ncbi:substrate-binding domain-containing protein [Pelobium sp.]|nr:substrate-binding domain-containing protein [Pelobium sp.]MDA9554991.1 substrate-binding domain-containing protein [Pelobium sp.]